LRRPSRSERFPKTSAPTTCPSRYTVARKPTAVVESPRRSLSVSFSPTLLAIVISRPSRIQQVPRATTIRVWNGDQGNRSMRAGIRERTLPGCSVVPPVAVTRTSPVSAAGNVVSVATQSRSGRPEFHLAAFGAVGYSQRLRRNVRKSHPQMARITTITSG
jgi:hypothetical protein